MTESLINIIFNYNNFVYWYISLFIIALFTIVTGITNFLWLKNIPSQKNNTNSKLVSILIPARNEADIIESTIKSITNQSYQNYELIILDDKSISACCVQQLLKNCHEERSNLPFVFFDMRATNKN